MGIPVVGRLFRSVKQCRMMSSRSRSINCAPRLMLYPQFKKEDEMSYRFLRLEDNKVEKFHKRGTGAGEVPANSSKIVGSSHGWLASFNERNGDLFLSDPVNGRHIKLPNLHTLLHVPGANVSKLILSCSPDEDGECRAMMRYGVGGLLAICSPHNSTIWTPLSKLMLDSHTNRAKVYSDFVYDSRRKCFLCLTPSFIIDVRRLCLQRYVADDLQCRWEQWDTCGVELLGSGPVPDGVLGPDYTDEDIRWPAWAVASQDKLDKCPVHINYLVCHSDEIYLLIRYLDGCDPYVRDDPELRKNLFLMCNPAATLGLDPGDLVYNPFIMNDPYMINRNKYDGDSPLKTVGFIAFKLDVLAYKCSEELVPLDSLDGLAMFVGVNHGFAIPASKYPELNLKPNSIYFTDDEGGGFRSGRSRCGGLDAGIFDYQNNIISPPCSNKFLPPAHKGSSRWIQHPPVWFTPCIPKTKTHI